MSSRYLRCAWPGLVLLVACSTVRKEDDGAGGSEGECIDALPEPPSRTTITVRNDTATSLYFPQTCGLVGPHGITLDGTNVFLSPEIVTCSDAFDGQCAPPPVNCGSPLIGELLAGASASFTWHGGVYQEVSPPASCLPEDCGGEPLTRCVAPAQLTAGKHLIDLKFRRDSDLGPMDSRQIEITLPADALTLVISATK